MPDGKFIFKYLVRDPIARTVSPYQMLVAAGKELVATGCSPRPRPVRPAFLLPDLRSLLPPVPEPELDEESRARLEELYAGDVNGSRGFTGKAFSSWSL